MMTMWSFDIIIDVLVYYIQQDIEFQFITNKQCVSIYITHHMMSVGTYY